MSKRYQRTPRNFDGTKATSHPIAEIMSHMLVEIDEKTKNRVQNIEVHWKEVIGEKIAPMTEVLSLDRGVLIVGVKSSTLYSLLCQHERPRLLAELQKRTSCEKIRDLKFRIK